MPTTPSAPILIYADGSCEGNPGPGGWGVVIVTPAGTHRLSGGDSQTTNNRMEIMAAIEALRALDAGVPVILRSDSQYLVKTMNEGWRRTKNLDLWKQLDAEVARHDVRFQWVRGHAGDARNEEADELARGAARSAALGRAPRRPGTTGAVGGAGAVAPPMAPSGTRLAAHGAAGRVPEDDDAGAVAELRPLLGHGERIARCVACGRSFVARDASERDALEQDDGDGGERHCALAVCQLEARRSGG
ncbi:MAG TPA: ribonuclease H, partial [Candidatus Binataceae bacterium]|nr:ribonuclease H [Candidatus Binataceae bacterium]